MTNQRIHHLSVLLSRAFLKQKKNQGKHERQTDIQPTWKSTPASEKGIRKDWLKIR